MLRKLLFVSFCVVVWVLFSVFSIFCITSLVSAKNPHPVQTYHQERKVKHKQILSSIDHKNMWDKHVTSKLLISLKHWNLWIFFTWWVIIPSTPDLFHVVCDIKVVITSQDSYASPSSKIIGFAVKNFAFLGILQKNADKNYQFSLLYPTKHKHQIRQ